MSCRDPPFFLRSFVASPLADFLVRLASLFRSFSQGSRKRSDLGGEQPTFALVAREHLGEEGHVGRDGAWEREGRRFVCGNERARVGAAAGLIWVRWEEGIYTTLTIYGFHFRASTGAE